MRVLLKISWEALAWWKWFGFDEKMLDKVTEIVKELIHEKHQVGIVVNACDKYKCTCSFWLFAKKVSKN